VDSGKPLPTELKEKSHILKKMCKRLDADDKNISGSNSGLEAIAKVIMAKPAIALGVLGLGGGYLLWENRRSLGSFVTKYVLKWTRKTGRITGSTKTASSIISDAQSAREARLKRFAALNAETEKES
jgi:hypothetical protein